MLQRWSYLDKAGCYKIASVLHSLRNLFHHESEEDQCMFDSSSVHLLRMSQSMVPRVSISTSYHRLQIKTQEQKSLIFVLVEKKLVFSFQWHWIFPKFYLKMKDEVFFESRAQRNLNPRRESSPWRSDALTTELLESHDELGHSAISGWRCWILKPQTYATRTKGSMGGFKSLLFSCNFTVVSAIGCMKTSEIFASVVYSL